VVCRSLTGTGTELIQDLSGTESHAKDAKAAKKATTLLWAGVPSSSGLGRLPASDDPSRAILAASNFFSPRAWCRGTVGYFCHGTTGGHQCAAGRQGRRTGLLVNQGVSADLLRSPSNAASARLGDYISTFFYDRPPLWSPNSLNRGSGGRVGPLSRRRLPVTPGLEAALKRNHSRIGAGRSPGRSRFCLLFFFSEAGT